MSGAPERVFLAAVLIGIGFGGNVLSRGALALFERIGIVVIVCFPLFFAGFAAGLALANPALLRSASVKSIGTLCFFKRSAKASWASSFNVAVRPRPTGSACRKYRRRSRSACAWRATPPDTDRSYSEAACQAQHSIAAHGICSGAKRSAKLNCSGEDERTRAFEYTARRLFPRS